MKNEVFKEVRLIRVVAVAKNNFISEMFFVIAKLRLHGVHIGIKFILTSGRRAM
jgi:hypothetical protein